MLVCHRVDACSLSLKSPTNPTVIFSKVRAATKVKAAIIVVFTSSGRAARYCYLFMHAYCPVLNEEIVQVLDLVLNFFYLILVSLFLGWLQNIDLQYQYLLL